MLINFDEKKFINASVKEIKEHMTVEKVYLEDIIDGVYEDLEEWFANYGLSTDLVQGIVEKLKEQNIEIIE